MDSTVVKSARRRPPNAGKGRKKGTPNKTTGTLKDAILLAAKQVGEDGDGAGGLTGYLRRVAREDVKAFAGLLGRVLPLHITGEITKTYVIRSPEPSPTVEQWQKQHPQSPTIQ